MTSGRGSVVRRVAALSLIALLFAPGACSTKTASSASTDDGGADSEALLGLEDGNTVGCTDIGGTCIPFNQACPPLQQNTALCENTVLVCCMLEGGASLPPPMEAGGGGGPESSTGPDVVSMPETSSPMEAGKDAAMMGKDAGMVKDAGMMMMVDAPAD
jgi:hypothetical protein